MSRRDITKLEMSRDCSVRHVTTAFVMHTTFIAILVWHEPSFVTSCEEHSPSSGCPTKRALGRGGTTSSSAVLVASAVVRVRDDVPSLSVAVVDRGTLSELRDGMLTVTPAFLAALDFPVVEGPEIDGPV